MMDEDAIMTIFNLVDAQLSAGLFVEVESDSPHLCAAFTPSGEMQTTGEQKVFAGLSIWQRCLTTGIWPGYSTEVLRLEPPKFMETQWADREAGDPLIAGALNNWRTAA
jgi:hypothetical protein